MPGAGVQTKQGRFYRDGPLRDQLEILEQGGGQAPMSTILVTRIVAERSAGVNGHSKDSQ